MKEEKKSKLCKYYGDDLAGKLEIHLRKNYQIQMHTFFVLERK